MSFNSLRNFFQLEAAGGICLVIGACAALLVANSPWSAHYAEVFSPSFSIIFENVAAIMAIAVFYRFHNEPFYRHPRFRTRCSLQLPSRSTHRGSHGFGSLCNCGQFCSPSASV